MPANRAGMRIATLALLCSLAFSGCGGDDDSSTDTDRGSTAPAASNATAADAAAKADAVKLVGAVEICFLDSHDYSSCDSSSDLPHVGVELGSDPGQTEVTDATASNFKIVAHSTSGNTFTLTKAKTAGDYERSCDVAGNDNGGCQGGTW
jgi:hypothetical protein